MEVCLGRIAVTGIPGNYLLLIKKSEPMGKLSYLKWLACFVLLLSHDTSQSQCVSTAWQTASTFATDNSTGVYDFSVPANAQYSDNARASAASLVSLLSGDSYYLKATGFAFTVPSNSSICGISVEIERRGTGLILTASIHDKRVKLIKGGIISGNNNAKPDDWTASDLVSSYGSSADMWGLTLTPTDVDDANFGVCVSVSMVALIAALPDAQIDQIKMKVYYNPMLPVRLEYFNAVQRNNTINLEWKTLEEEEGASITLQRSLDGVSWTDISSYRLSITNGPKQYSFIDSARQNVRSSYRLRTELASGVKEYSQIRSVIMRANEMNSIYPNPASSYINVGGKDPQVSDPWGRRWFLPIEKTVAGSHIIVSSVPKGIYFVRSTAGVSTFVKE
jgi:hypothetical protein